MTLVIADRVAPVLPHIEMLQGRQDEAEPLFTESLSLRRRVLGDDHPAVAQSLNNLAALYDDQDRYAEAEPLYVQAVSIAEKALGPDHPDTQLFATTSRSSARRSSNVPAIPELPANHNSSR